MKSIKEIAISGLIDKMVPFGAGSIINTIISEIQTRRFRAFLDQAAKGETQLTQEVIEKEDFLHNYFATVQAVLNTRRIEKIRLLGNLFNRAVSTNTIINTDEYEFYLKILDELNFIEIELLSLLDELESSLGTKSMKRREHQRTNTQAWPKFREQCSEKFNIPIQQVDDYFIRIERTGCVHIPRIEASNARPYSAITTSTFSKLKEMIFETKP